MASDQAHLNSVVRQELQEMADQGIGMRGLTDRQIATWLLGFTAVPEVRGARMGDLILAVGDARKIVEIKP